VAQGLFHLADAATAEEHLDATATVIALLPELIEEAIDDRRDRALLGADLGVFTLRHGQPLP
jgi:hypothetical protein